MFTVFVAAIAVGVFVMYFRHDHRMRTLRRASVRPIGELPEDTPGRVVGKIEAHGRLLTAPFSGAACIYYRVDIEHAPAPASPNDAEQWRLIASETDSVAFIIADPTGRALVEPTAAKVELTSSPPVIAHPDALTPATQAFLLRHQISDPRAKLRYREAVIAVGDAVAVFGSGVREPDPDAFPAGYRGDRPTRLRLTSSPRHPLFITTDHASS